MPQTGDDVIILWFKFIIYEVNAPSGLLRTMREL